MREYVARLWAVSLVG